MKERLTSDCLETPKKPSKSLYSRQISGSHSSIFAFLLNNEHQKVTQD